MRLAKKKGYACDAYGHDLSAGRPQLARLIHEPLQVESRAGLVQRVGSRRALPGAHHRRRVWEPSQGSRDNPAWEASELCSARTIAGGLGNPPRVPMTIVLARRR